MLYWYFLIEQLRQLIGFLLANALNRIDLLWIHE